MKRQALITVTCVLSAPWAAVGQADTPAAPDQIEFRFVPRPGQTVRLRRVSKAVGSAKLFDPIPEQKFSQSFEQGLVARCREVNPDGSAVLEISMPYVAMNMDFGGFKSGFDSRAPAPSTQARNPGQEFLALLCKAMTGLTLTVGPYGQPIKLEGLSEGMKKIVEDLPKESVSPLAGQLLDMMCNDATMMDQFNTYYRICPPEKTTRVGSTWRRNWQMKLPMFKTGLKGTGQYELLGIEEFRGRQCAKVGIKESFATAPLAESQGGERTTRFTPAESVLDRMNFEMSSSGGEGIAYWDYENGHLVQLRQTQRMTIEISLKPDAKAQDAELKKGLGPMVQKAYNSVTVELIEASEASGDANAPSAAPATASTLP